MTATDTDREFAGQGRDFVTIEGRQSDIQEPLDCRRQRVTWDAVITTRRTAHWRYRAPPGQDCRDGYRRGQDPRGRTARIPPAHSTGRGVHVVTVNDYLSKRDSGVDGSAYMFTWPDGRLYRQARAQLRSPSQGYACDIAFGTNNEFGFDYLRDNMPCRLGPRAAQRHYLLQLSMGSTRCLSTTPVLLLIISGSGTSGRRPALQRIQSTISRMSQRQLRLVRTSCQ